ncbi:hypothetical protein [Mycobacteroides abscessus]|uniref:hypothetical protein n=1 Tax=Mycobacteroides abscessus TaxID=36809 RepID=UPI000C2672FB|nr:hypothetical protein [Mycobacteroides abscessus]
MTAEFDPQRLEEQRRERFATVQAELKELDELKIDLSIKRAAAVAADKAVEESAGAYIAKIEALLKGGYVTKAALENEGHKKPPLRANKNGRAPEGQDATDKGVN